MQFRKVLAVFLAVSVLTYAQGNSFTKVRYNGGSVSTTVKPDDWDNKLTVNSESISLMAPKSQAYTLGTPDVSKKNCWALQSARSWRAHTPFSTVLRRSRSSLDAWRQCQHSASRCC